MHYKKFKLVEPNVNNNDLLMLSIYNVVKKNRITVLKCRHCYVMSTVCHDACYLIQLLLLWMHKILDLCFQSFCIDPYVIIPPAPIGKNLILSI